MKPIILATFLVLIALHSSAQCVTGLQVGVGVCAPYLRPLIPTPGCEVFFLPVLSGNFAFGLAASVQRYSFVQSNADAGNTSYLGVLSITQQSTYLFVSPRVDFGIGKHQTLHATVSLGVGKLLSGVQSADVNYMDTHYGSYAGYYSRLANLQENSTGDINAVVFVVKVGLTEQVSNANGYTVCLFQEFSYLPSYICKYPNKSQYAIYDYRYADQFFLKTNYFSCGISIARDSRAKKQNAKAKKTADRYRDDDE